MGGRNRLESVAELAWKTHLRDGAPPLPIKAGQFLVIPRNTLHGLRNTGNRRLSYLGVNAGAEPGK